MAFAAGLQLCTWNLCNPKSTTNPQSAVMQRGPVLAAEAARFPIEAGLGYFIDLNKSKSNKRGFKYIQSFSSKAICLKMPSPNYRQT